MWSYRVIKPLNELKDSYVGCLTAVTSSGVAVVQVPLTEKGEKNEQKIKQL
jgi:hypothetical protein